jgi:hypothetical protein
MQSRSHIPTAHGALKVGYKTMHCNTAEPPLSALAHGAWGRRKVLSKVADTL